MYYEGAVGGVRLLKVQLKDIVISGQDREIAHGAFQKGHVCGSGN
jgi:hypothetical protein